MAGAQGGNVRIPTSPLSRHVFVALTFFTVFSTVGEGAAPETQPQLALLFCPWWFRSGSPGLLGIRKAVSMAHAEGRAAKCCIHLLKFAGLPEFPGDSVDLSDVGGRS